MKTIAVLSFVTLLGVPLSADCGWVLWSRRSAEGGRGATTWNIETAVPTFDRCRGELTRNVELALTVGSLGNKRSNLS